MRAQTAPKGIVKQIDRKVGINIRVVTAGDRESLIDWLAKQIEQQGLNAQLLDRPVYATDGSCGIVVVLDAPDQLAQDKAQLDRVALDDLYPGMKNPGEIYEIGVARTKLVLIHADARIVDDPEAMGFAHMLEQTIFDEECRTRNAAVSTNVALFGKPDSRAKRAMLDNRTKNYRELDPNPEQASDDEVFTAYDVEGTLVSVAQGSKDVYAVNADDARSWVNDDDSEREAAYKLAGTLNADGEITGLGTPDNGVFTATVKGSDRKARFPHFAVTWDDSRDPQLIQLQTLVVGTDKLGDNTVVCGRGFKPEQLALQNRLTGAFSVRNRRDLPSLARFGQRDAAPSPQ